MLLVVRHHVERNQTNRLSCQARPAVLFLKGTFEILANTRSGAPATIPDALPRRNNIFGALSPIQATAPDQGCLLFAGTRRSQKREQKVVRHNSLLATG